MSKKKLELTEGEWAIMLAVWALEPCAAPTVQEHLEDTTRWSYSTVKTMMDRMVKKGFLRTEKIRNLFLYRSSVTRKQAQKGEVMRTLKRAFDGAFTPMMQFLIDSGGLSKKELAQLEKLIRKKRNHKTSPDK
jgi:predicted transcriptional regulator